MHSIIFSYKELNRRFMPIIPLTLYGPRESLLVEAYVDSGATFSIFSLELAKGLKLDLKNARRQMFVVGDGSFIPAQLIKMPIQVGEEKFICDIAFSDRLNVGFNLLGRLGVFEYFDEIIFRESKKEIVFRWKK